MRSIYGEEQFKIAFFGEITSVQPRSNVWWYLMDNRTHSLTGYNLFLKGRADDEKKEFAVAILEKQQQKLLFHIGDVISGTGWTKKYPEMEYADYYRAGSLKKLSAGEVTRTKNRVYFIAPEQNPSEFLLEIKHDYKSVILKGKWNEEETKQNSTRKTCPICGYPLQFRYKNAYGLKLYMCTNDQEICGFMTNDIKAGKLAIMKCDKCRDGYLIVKSAGNGYFLGCTNYKKDKTGCNNTIGTNEYLTLKNIEPDFAEPFVSAVSVVPVEEKPTVSAEHIKMNANRTKEWILAGKKSEVKSESQTKEVVVEQKKETVKTITSTSKDSNVLSYKGQDLYGVARNVISCLGHISDNYYFGISI